MHAARIVGRLGRVKASIAWVAYAAGLTMTVSCTPREVAEGPLVLGPDAFVVNPTPPLDAPGPEMNLCVTLPDTYGLSVTAPLRIQRGDNRLMRLRAVLTEEGGNRTVLDHEGGSFAHPYASPKEFCFVAIRPVDHRRRFVRLEIFADDTLTVQAVRWWSGQRQAFL